MERSGFWRRAIAAGLDLAMGGSLAGALGMAVVIVIVIAAADVSDEATEVAAGVTFYGALLVYTSTEAWFGASPGKWIMSLTIGTPAGAAAGRWTLALRWSSKYFGLFLALVYALTLNTFLEVAAGFMNTVVMVGCLPALGEDRRAWHDEWAGTAVLRRPARVSATPPPPIMPGGGSDAR